MRVFQGDAFTRGQQEGSFYATQGVTFPGVVAKDILRDQLAYYEKAAPERLEELRGIASGGGYAFEAVAHRFLVDEILLIRAFELQAARSCSIGGVIGNDGRLWVARNYDWQAVIADHLQLWRFDSAKASVAIVSDMGILSEKDSAPSRQFFFPDDAVNDRGLYIGLTFAYCWKTGIGLATADAIRLVAARCGTVEEALAFFEDNKICCGKNFFVADRKTMAVVQHAQTAFDVHRPDENGVLAVTNNYVGGLETQDHVPDALPHNTTFERFSRLKDDLTKLHGNVSFEALDRIMTDGRTPVCQYFPDFSIETVWTFLSDQTRGDYRLIANPRSPQRRVTDFRVG